MASFQPTPIQIEDLQAISIESFKRPAMPVSTYLQEANDLYVWSQDDREKLLRFDLSPITFDELVLGINLLSYYQGEWKKEQGQVNPIVEAFAAKKQEARELQQHLVASLRFAFRRHPSLLQKLSLSVRRTPLSVWYQSLNDLAVLGEAESDLLLAIGFNLDELGVLRQLATELPEWHALASKQVAPSKELRDRAYCYLKKRVDDLRTCGKYVFREDPSRRVGYVSQFMRRKSQAQKRSRSNQDR